MRLAAAILLLLLCGCASKHAYMSKPIALGDETWVCPTQNTADCYRARPWKPSQLTIFGCAAHTLVTSGHIAYECRKPKPNAVPVGGRWIWQPKKHNVVRSTPD